ncbi:F-box protein At3g07870-like [Papaver somniferum]|uniref:F-box protein At3g07870-like n=1 Tax=Papaver somniferum TaxID=3469 RepID=UPI000E6F5EFB|nr:F-box protein At3g07870-like [Papaver somniferum]
MVGSCNGLVCFCIPHHRVNDPVYICNPITTEYINLPRLEIKYGVVISGFGYHFSSNTYKVVRIHYTDRFRTFEPITKGSVEIYTLGSGTGWRNIGEITYKLCDTGVLANGSLYWLDYEQKRIVVFPLGDEHFRCLPTIPQCLRDSENATYHVKVLGGDLCLVHVDAGKHVHIWSYKNKHKRNDIDNDKEEGYQSLSWTLEFRIPCIDPDGKYEPFALTKKNEVLLWLNRTCLCCYDKTDDCLYEIVAEDRNLSFGAF